MSLKPNLSTRLGLIHVNEARLRAPDLFDLRAGTCTHCPPRR